MRQRMKMAEYLVRLPKHLRRAWGRVIRRSKYPAGVGLFAPTRRGFMYFQHSNMERERAIWRKLKKLGRGHRV